MVDLIHSFIKKMCVPSSLPLFKAIVENLWQLHKNTIKIHLITFIYLTVWGVTRSGPQQEKGGMPTPGQEQVKDPRHLQSPPAEQLLFLIFNIIVLSCFKLNILYGDITLWLFFTLYFILLNKNVNIVLNSNDFIFYTIK